MTYRDEINTPSLDGVEFKNLSIRSTIGRRTVLYIFPLKDDAKGRDLGARPDKFQISGVLVGDFYHLELESLRDVLKSEGPWEFVHPYWGIFWCQLDGEVTIVEDPAKGGSASFTIPLVDVSTADFPQVFDDPGPAVLSAYYLAVGALALDLDAALAYVPLGVSLEEAEKNRPGFLQSLTNALNKVGQVLGKVNGKVAGRLNKLNDLSNALNDISAGVTTLLNTPGALASTLQGVLNSLVGIGKAFQKDTTTSPSDGIAPSAAADATLEAMGGADIDMGSDAVPLTTPSREQEAAALAGMETFLKSAAACEAAAAAVELTMATADQATDYAAQVGAVLVAGAEDENASDETYQRMGELDAALRQYIHDVSANLPALREFEVGAPTHALLVAHWVYGDALQDQSIIDQNNIANPLFTGTDGPVLVVDA